MIQFVMPVAQTVPLHLQTTILTTPPVHLRPPRPTHIAPLLTMTIHQRLGEASLETVSTNTTMHTQATAVTTSMMALPDRPSFHRVRR